MHKLSLQLLKQTLQFLGNLITHKKYWQVVGIVLFCIVLLSVTKVNNICTMVTCAPREKGI